MMSAPETGGPMNPVSHRRSRGRIGALAVTCVAALSLGSLAAAPAVGDGTLTAPAFAVAVLVPMAVFEVFTAVPLAETISMLPSLPITS